MITTLPSLGLKINDYPAIKRHLLSYGKDRLAQTGKRLPDGRRTRKKTPHQWFELQDTCAYHGDFFKEKLFWITLSPEGRFAYFNQTETYCLNSAYMLTGTSIKFLCAILNSQLIRWFVQSTAVNSGMGVPQWIKSSIDMIPIPRPCEEIDDSFVCLVDRILEAKTLNYIAETTEWEYQVDRMVYSLYDLTDIESDAIARVLGEK